MFGLILIYDYSESGVHDVTMPIIQPFRVCSTFTICTPQERVVVDENDNAVIGKEILVNLAHDHKCADGSDGVVFLKAFKQVFENPEKFMK